MKRFINTFVQFALFLTLAFGASSFAEASSFVSEPWSDGKGVTTVGATDYSSNDANSINLPSNGTFYAFIAYQNATNTDLVNVRARFDFPESGSNQSVNIQGSLGASNGQTEADSATINGMPSEWDMEIVSAYVFNDHGNLSSCTPSNAYNYTASVSSSALTNGWANLPSGASVLDTYQQSSVNGYSGACDQGHLVAEFRVTDTSASTMSLSLQTNPASSISSNGARLNGEVLSGTTNDIFFVYGTSSSISCTASGVSNPPVYGTYNAGDDFYHVILNGLNTGTTYYYRACAQDGSGVISAYNSKQFTTLGGSNGGGGNGGSTTDPEAVTYSENNVTDDSAELNGYVDMNSFENGEVYFVYWDNANDPTSAVSVLVDSDLDDSETYSLVINNLDDSTVYYYQICVSYNNGSDLECGSVGSFETDDSNGGGSSNNDDPDAITYNEDNVDADSAELNGYVDMNSFENGDVFFVWGQSSSQINNVDNENSYGDVDQDGDNLQKYLVDDDLDSSQSYSLDVYSLEEGEDYFFRICVDYYDGGEEMECGTVKSFTTGGGDSDIVTKLPDSVGVTSAKICGDLEDDGGDNNLRTWMEYKKSTSSTWEKTDKYDRGEGYYCDTAYGLNSDTKYDYRACSDDSCGYVREFRTANSYGDGEPKVSTISATNIASNSAVLNGYYVANDDEVKVWFNYGRTQALGNKTVSYTKNGVYGAFAHNFTNLASNTYYYYQAVAKNSEGTVYGDILRFQTGGNGYVEVVQDVGEDIDLASLGLGLSLIQLEIDDDRERVVRGQEIEYTVTWENISTLDLTDLDLKITLPEEVTITNTSRGNLDKDQNAIFYTIDDLEDGEDGDLIIFATVTGGSLGDLLTAEATIAFDNPVNQAQENATDYDVDEFAVQTNFGTASVFGLSQISFLGWLVILLGLLVIFLVARWLYLEREDLRARAYANGYGRAPRQNPHYDNYNQSQAPYQRVNNTPNYYDTPQAPQGGQQASSYEAPVNNSDDGNYRPYRPNR